MGLGISGFPRASSFVIRHRFMTLLALVGRELRVAARHSFTYYLRTLGVGALLLAGVLLGIENDFAANIGGDLFDAFHRILFWTIWALVPLLTADCLSRERREGTLGMLFLTRLRPSAIVVAKGLAHGLRALTMVLAVLPVLAIPFLLGGVSWDQAAMSAMVNFSAMCWALAAGLLASAWSKSWRSALLKTLVLATLFMLALGVCALILLLVVRRPIISLSEVGSSGLIGEGIDLLANTNWRYLPSAARGSLLRTMGQITLVSVLVLALAIVLAGAKTRRVWQEEPPSLRRLWWQRKFCEPIFWGSSYRRWKGRKLAKNPIGWLEQRTWSGRSITWGWLAVIISIFSIGLAGQSFLSPDDELYFFMAWLLAGSMALSAAGSFRRERDAGLLELLLVSPLAESTIIWGRVRGLWSQFFPASGVLLGIWTYSSCVLQKPPYNTFSYIGTKEQILFFAVTFLTLPVIGLYFSLRYRNFVAALLATVAVGLLAPMVLWELPDLLWWLYAGGNAWFANQMGPSRAAATIQIAFAAVCWQRLHVRLKRRTFPLARD